MKRLCCYAVLIAVVLHCSNADASVGWGGRGRNSAVGRSRHPRQGTVNFSAPETERSTSTEGSALNKGHLTPASRRHLLRPSLTLRGGNSGAIHGTADGDRVALDTDGAAGKGGAVLEANGDDADADGIDEDLYSRQLYVMGKSAMAKMGKADVLISGMRYVRKTHAAKGGRMVYASRTHSVAPYHIWSTGIRSTRAV